MILSGWKIITGDGSRGDKRPPYKKNNLCFARIVFFCSKFFMVIVSCRTLEFTPAQAGGIFNMLPTINALKILS